MCGENIVAAEGLEHINFNKLISLNESAAYLWSELCGKEFTHALVHEDLDEPITFKKYPCNADYLLTLREKLNHLIEKRS